MIPKSVILFVIALQCHNGLSITQRDTPNDPLYLFRKYYKDHDEYRVEDVPVVETFEDSYDFVIIGSGSGGSVMANRLSEIADWRVLLLEAGGQGDYVNEAPLLWLTYSYDWGYKTEKQSACCQQYGGECAYPSGKVLGGSSVINAILYSRGNRHTYDDWSRMGNPGWSYKDALKYFKKSEGIQIEQLKNSPYHERGGYLNVDTIQYDSKLTNVCLAAGKELGYDILDYNGETQTSFSRFQVNSKNGRRISALTAFLKPVASRKNLSIATEALVTKILIDPITKTATGVEFKKNGVVYNVAANKEVILSGGTVNSPQVLMLSGIGPRKHLTDIDIDVIKDLPIGRGLKDHVGIGDLRFDIDLKVTITDEVLNSYKDIANFFEKGEGPLTVPSAGSIAVGWMKTKYAKNYAAVPDVELIFSITNMSATLKPEKEAPATKSHRKKVANNRKLFDKKHTRDFYRMPVLVLYPKSEGTIELRSKNPEEHPKIDTRCFMESYDKKILMEGLKLAVKVSRTKAFAKYNTTLNPTPYKGCEHLVFESDEYWECAITQQASTLYHQVGTCKMGPASDPTAVVDARLKVHGIKGLRVVDASIMPTIPAAHPNAVVYMIGEKAADMVKEDWGVLPIPNRARHTTQNKRKSRQAVIRTRRKY